MGSHGLRGWSASRASRREQPHGRNGCGCSHSPAFNLRRKAALGTKKDEDGATEQERPGPALSFRLAASCRRASKNSFHSFSWGSCTKPRTVWLRPIFGATTTNTTTIPVLWAARLPVPARPRSAPSFDSLAQRNALARALGALVPAPRRVGCGILRSHGTTVHT